MDFMRKIFFLLILIVLCVGCSKEQTNMTGVAAECNGSFITYAELDALTKGLSAEDSAHVANQSVERWATAVLASGIVRGEKGDPEIERLVAEYRNSLYQHKWEETQAARNMSHHVEDSVMLAFYEEHKQHYVLEEALICGLILVIPQGAPNMDKLREMVKNPREEENIEWTEKYAYQYAAGYELFLDEWQTSTHIVSHIPISIEDLHSSLKKKKQIEVTDSAYVYLLQVTDVCMAGEYKPFDFAKSDVKEKILNERRVEYIQSERKRLYNDAVKQGKIKRYGK